MNDEEYRREELIREIEHRVEQMTLRQLEALQYELETKDYSADDAGWSFVLFHHREWKQINHQISVKLMKLQNIIK